VRAERPRSDDLWLKGFGLAPCCALIALRQQIPMKMLTYVQQGFVFLAAAVGAAVGTMAAKKKSTKGTVAIKKRKKAAVLNKVKKAAAKAKKAMKKARAKSAASIFDEDYLGMRLAELQGSADEHATRVDYLEKLLAELQKRAGDLEKLLAEVQKEADEQRTCTASSSGAKAASDDAGKGTGKGGKGNVDGKGKGNFCPYGKGKGKDGEGKGKKGAEGDGKWVEDQQEQLERARMWRTLERHDLLILLQLRVNDVRSKLIGSGIRLDEAIENLDSLQWELQHNPGLDRRQQ